MNGRSHHTNDWCLPYHTDTLTYHTLRRHPTHSSSLTLTHTHVSFFCLLMPSLCHIVIHSFFSHSDTHSLLILLPLSLSHCHPFIYPINSYTHTTQGNVGCHQLSSNGETIKPRRVPPLSRRVRGRLQRVVGVAYGCPEAIRRGGANHW